MAEKTKNQFYKVAVTTLDIVADPTNRTVITNDDSQLLYGERVILSDEPSEHKGWVKATSCIDDYKGYVQKEFLRAAHEQDTHFVEALLTHIYPEPSFKTHPVMPLSFMSRLRITDETETDGFVKLDDGGWVFKDHILPVSELKQNTPDPADTALRFVGTPYLYGGRSAAGIDCSALVQLAMIRAGMNKCLRDSGPQKDTIGRAIDEKDLQRGDLVFFPGHVGIMQDEKTVINATARKMATVIEPLDKLVKSYGPATATRRPF